jgi:ArsR family transcriptional regulator
LRRLLVAWKLMTETMVIKAGSHNAEGLCLTHRQISIRLLSMREAVQFAHALADETRWRIVRLVFDQALCVCELADVLRLPQSTLSSHLKVIQRADLLECERRGKWMFYRVKAALKPLLRGLFKHFNDSGKDHPVLARDARQMEIRLGQREKLCCPGPTTTPIKRRALAATR